MPSDTVLTIGVFILFSSLAHLATKVVARNQSLEIKRFWQLTFRNVAMVAGVIALGAIWRNELQSVLVALGAAAAGIFVAFREAWLSLLAFWIRVVKRHYSIGDYIEIDGIRGRVVDITWQHTVLAESSSGRELLPFSGRQVQVPNNRMLLANLYVENMTGEYTPHNIVVALPCGANVMNVEQLIKNLGAKHCVDFRNEAAAHMAWYQSHKFVEAPSVDPKTNLILTDHGNVSILLRIVVPANKKMVIEQAILHDLFSQITPDIWPPNGRCK